MPCILYLQKMATNCVPLAMGFRNGDVKNKLALGFGDMIEFFLMKKIRKEKCILVSSNN